MGDALDHLSNRTKLEWTSSLNTDYTPKKNYRRTSIIGTIGRCFVMTLQIRGLTTMVPGPKTNSVEKITLLRKGSNWLWHFACQH